MPKKTDKPPVKLKTESVERSFHILIKSLRELCLKEPSRDYFNFLEIVENCKTEFLAERKDITEEKMSRVIGVLLTARYQRQDVELPLLKRIRVKTTNDYGGSYRYNINLDVYNSIYGSDPN
jgi:hypothetical protein